jgi:hypothetical protein
MKKKIEKQIESYKKELARMKKHMAKFVRNNKDELDSHAVGIMHDEARMGAIIEFIGVLKKMLVKNVK